MKSKTTSTASSNKDEVVIQKENNLGNLLLIFFRTINTIDNQIENIPGKFKILKNFSSKNLFNYLDKNSKGYLTLNDFIIFLQSNQISFAEKNLRKLIHIFDKDNDFSINFKEFLGIISPKKGEIKKEQKETILQKKEGDILISNEIKKIFGELIIEELKFVEKCYDLSQNIKNCKEFTIFEAFTEIAGGEKYINIQNLGNFLKYKGLKIVDEELKQLMFRIDSYNDGKISYEEFKEIFMLLNDIDFKYKDYKDKNSYLKLYNEDKYVNNENDKNDNKDKLEFKYGKSEDDFKIDLQLKINSIKIKNNNINSNDKDNKENNKNEINIKQKYKYNLKFEPKDIIIKDKKFLFENEDIQNVSNFIYDEKLNYDKSIIMDNQINQIKEKDNNNIFNKKIIQRNPQLPLDNK